MKEKNFVEQNKEKWLKYEKMSYSYYKNPDELSDLFIQVTEDLSYTRTFYPKRKINQYLNFLVQEILGNLGGNYQLRWQQFAAFWGKELPAIVHQSRLELGISFILFTLSFLVGVISSINDPNFSRAILGDAYINMTLENIENEDPMAVYKTMNEVDMFLGISLNNAMVAFRTFILGLFFSVGTISILIYNGIMVGTFQYFFIERGLFIESFLTIWLHGTLEISSIILSGGAGILLGKGIVFPGTYSRLDSIKVYASRALKLLLGVLPILLLAAVIESYVTRHTELSTWLKLGIILSSLTFILGYFVWYPRYLLRKGVDLSLEHQFLDTPPKELIIQGKTKTISEIFRDSIYFFRTIFKSYLLVFLGILFCNGILVYFLFGEDTLFLKIRDWVDDKWILWFQYRDYPELFILNSILLSISMIYILRKIELFLHPQRSFHWLKSFQVLVLILLFNMLLFVKGWGINVLLVLLIPLLFFIIFTTYFHTKNFFWGLSDSFKKMNNNYLSLWGLYLLNLILGFLFFTLCNTPIILFYEDVIKWVLPSDTLSPKELMLLVNATIFVSVLLISSTVLLISFAFQYFSFQEINEANTLKNKIAHFSRP